MAKSFKNLEVWKKAIDFADMIYRITKQFPKEELFGITSQLRRAVVSISSNIAEGSLRGSSRDYARCIDSALGSLKEAESLIERSLRLGFLSFKEHAGTLERINEISGPLGGFRKYLLKKKK